MVSMQAQLDGVHHLESEAAEQGVLPNYPAEVGKNDQTLRVG